MSLQLILGNAGTGKSYALYEELIQQSIQNPEGNYLIIVPEQFTMQTQKDLVTQHPNQGIMNIDVLSFERLAYRIFDEVGGNDKIVLEETGKSLVLRKVAKDKQAELKVLKGNLHKMGYINEIKSLLSELAQYNVTPLQLEGLLKTMERTSLQYKMEDILVMYKGFVTYMEEKYITAEKILELLCSVVDQSNLLKNSVIALDGFTGFTPIQNNLLQKLMGIVPKMYVTVTLDTRENPYQLGAEYQLFYMSKKTIGRLVKMAEETNVLLEKTRILDFKTEHRFKNSPALRWLEQNLFRYQQNVYEKEQDDVQIHVSKNPKEELKFVGKEISRLVRDEQYRYGEIAVVTGDIETYSHYAEEVFKEFEIPTFLDYKKNIVFHPFIEYIRAILEMAEHDFSYGGVFRYLKSGLTPISSEEIDLLENYVLAYGIRGHKKWSQKWIHLHKGLREEELEVIQSAREKIMEDLHPLFVVWMQKEVTVFEQTRVLYEFIVKQQIQKQLKEYENQFTDSNQLALAKEYAQIYRIVMDLFDKMVDLLGDDILTIKEYGEILDAGFAAAKVGVIPLGWDRVVIGDIERTRLNHVRILLFVGVNDGIIPKANQGGGIISQLEREALAKQQVELAPSAREKAFIQKFYLYINMTKPKERLYLSYSKVSMEGKSIRSSYLIPSIRKLFPLLQVIDEEEKGKLFDKIFTPNQGISIIIEGLQRHIWEEAKEEYSVRLWYSLLGWYQKQDNWNQKSQTLLNAAFCSYDESKISTAVARAIYGTTLENSVTRLEKYAACSFAHFLDYGLQLSERVTHEFAAMDMGNIFHHTLEKFASLLKENDCSWFDVSREVQHRLVEQALEETILGLHNDILFKDSRNAYMVERMKRIMNRTVWALSEQVKMGSFEPSSYEVSFLYGEQIDSKICLKGRIDRVDVYENENDDKVYVKIIDYKSGSTSFELLSLYYGLQLQLVVYLNAAVEIEQKMHPGKEIIPAGIFYYNVKDPITDKVGDVSEQEIEIQLLEELRMNGLVNESQEVLSLLDKDCVGTSKVLPIRKNKDGSLSKNSSAVTKEEFQVISDYVNKTIRKIGTKILGGDIQINPYQLGERTGCDYCSYQGVCGFDQKIEGYVYKKLTALEQDEVIQKMREEENL